jgi:hypothetical protein
MRHASLSLGQADASPGGGVAEIPAGLGHSMAISEMLPTRYAMTPTGSRCCFRLERGEGLRRRVTRVALDQAR